MFHLYVYLIHIGDTLFLQIIIKQLKIYVPLNNITNYRFKLYKIISFKLSIIRIMLI